MLKFIRLLLIQLVQETTIEVKLPLILTLSIELISNLQILSLVLLPLSLGNLDQTSQLSVGINKVLSYLEPFQLVNPFNSGGGVRIVLIFTCLYFLGYLLLVCHAGYKILMKRTIPEPIAKIMSFLTIFHSRILFYFIHCFVMKALTIERNYCSNPRLFTCKLENTIIPIVLLIFNVGFAAVQELLCYQIHQNTNTYGLKNNLHNLNKLLLKFLIILMFYVIEEPAKVLITFNILGSLLDLIILHMRLPYYNLTVLKLSVSCSTISAALSLITMARFWNNGENICLVLLSISPLIVKMSMIQLNKTFRNIFNLKFYNVYQAVHLPVLLKNYFGKIKIFPVPDKSTRATLYSLGFLSSEIESMISLSDPNQHLTDLTLENQKAAYKKAIQELTLFSKKNPQNELLVSVYIAQIYVQVFADSFKTLAVVNKFNEKNTGFVGIITLQALSKSLLSLHQNVSLSDQKQDKRKASHLNYFAVKKKTLALKTRVQTEIEEHLKLWRSFNSNEIDVLSVINQAALISAQAHIITNYWGKNFEGQEVLYVNACVIYGLYLEMVQAIPSGGSGLIRKAYNSMNNKFHVNRDVIDVAIGHSAVIVASIEPDKIGRIIDASSSVKDLFRANKQSLIGSNIGIVMPNIVAMRHNDLIKGYHQRFKENIDHCITTYAKTLQDDYFRVEVSLHVSPLTHKGLNMVSYIRKLSEHQSIMIIDSQSNIIEYSKDLSLPLNLYAKRSHIKIESLCPQFRTINQAFDLLFKPQDIDEKPHEDEKPFMEEMTMMMPKSPKLTVVTTEMGLISPTFQRFALNSMENEAPLLLKSENRELSEYEQQVGTPKTNVTSAKSVPLNHSNMSTIEAQEIWDNFKNNKGLVFYPYTKMQSVTSQRKIKEFKFKAEVEALPFDGKWYKVIRLRGSHSDNPFSLTAAGEETSHREIMPSAKEKKGFVAGVVTVGDDFADNFPSDEERTEVDILEDGQQNSKNLADRIEPRKSIMKYVKNATLSNHKSDLEGEDSFEDKIEGIDEPNNPRKVSNKAQSVIDSQASQKVTAKRLNNSLKIEKQGKSMKFAISMVYLAVIAIICSICIYLVYTTQSLQEMEDAMSLIQLVNLRLSKTILSLQAIMVLYARSVKLRPIDYRVPKYQVVAINSSLDVLDNARKLAEEADKFAKKEIIESLYAKTVAMYEPLAHTGQLFNGGMLDQFSSNQILIGLFMSIARYKGSYLDLKGSRDMLFAINNTANDYLLTLDRSISDISDFFEKTKNTNTGLLKGIAGVEIFFVVIPLVVIFAILIITVKLYSKLFNAICKIHEQSLSRRLCQLEEISKLFKESIEDDFTYFNDIKKYRDAATQSHTKPLLSKNKGKSYKVQNLLVYILKYVIIASFLTVFVIIPIVLSLNTSTKYLENLDVIKGQAETIYGVGSQVKMMLPTFFITIIFTNDTTYKIRNNPPRQEMLSQVEVLAESTKTLLNTLSDENGDIPDPLIKEILDGHACQYVTFNYTQNCIQNTRGEEYALLGLQAAYRLVTQPMKQFAQTVNPTWALGASLSSQYASLNNNYHFVIFDLYDKLTDHLVNVFIESAETYKDDTKKMFYECLAVFFAAMILIRVIVLSRLQLLDLGIRRILRIIPYKIIEENKVMSCYLARAFQNELKALKQLS